MNEQDEPKEKRHGTVSGARVFTAITPSADDIEKAKLLAVDACPRRYCWWWRSLSFEWNVPVEVGCTYLRAEKPPSWRMPDAPCVRCNPDSTVDQFEPREPHMLEDGVDGTAWFVRSNEFNGTTPHPGWEEYFLPAWRAKNHPAAEGG